MLQRRVSHQQDDSVADSATAQAQNVRDHPHHAPRERPSSSKQEYVPIPFTVAGKTSSTESKETIDYIMYAMQDYSEEPWALMVKGRSAASVKRGDKEHPMSHPQEGQDLER